MTSPQRIRRLRQIAARRTALDAERSALDAEARALENEQSWEMGFNVPLRGRALMDEIGRREGVAA